MPPVAKMKKVDSNILQKIQALISLRRIKKKKGSHDAGNDSEWGSQFFHRYQ